MKNFKIALVQHRATTTDTEANTARALEFIREAKENAADFVLFPECFLTSYQMPEICHTLRPLSEISSDPSFVKWCENALDEDSACLREIRAAARKLRIGVGITSFTRGRERPQNSIFIIDRNGEILMKYSKVHTCDFDVERYLEGGEAFRVCEFDGICLGAMICYDREYPESGRELMLQGAEIVLVPNDCDLMEPRLRELSVQAMQNMTGVVMANPPGKNAGASCAFLPMVWDDEGNSVDNTITVASAQYDGIVYASFDMNEIRRYRDSEFLGKNRKPTAYRHLLS